MAENAAIVHPLSLKVMRLSRPCFQLDPKSDVVNELDPVDAPEDIRWESSEACVVSQLLSLPISFGNIYLGETFSSYLCINNEATGAVDEVCIKAELQTSSQRFTLADTLSVHRQQDSGDQSQQPSKVSLLPTQSAEFLVHHEIKELGIHILVCSVHYTSGGSKKYFRKFYKFQVLNPLAVKTKVNTFQDGRVFLEAQVQNVTGNPIYLERLRFEPSDLFDYVDMNHALTHQNTNTNNIQDIFSQMDKLPSIFGKTNCLPSQDSRQYLYILNPKTKGDPIARTTPTLGKLDIVWRTLLGQAGRLQTSQLSRKPVQVELFDVFVIDVPTTILSEEAFSVTCRLRNNDLSATQRFVISGIKSKMSSVLLWGPAETEPIEIPPLGYHDFNLSFYPLLSGLHKIVGLRIAEMHSKTYRDVENLCDIFVSVPTGEPINTL
ncbi:hypothetical protein HDU67_005093 [Dinochytrium kinnereticum]|nr:hypothetical protein HDU67_005093 [Dinochytrium kinnereticum]